MQLNFIVKENVMSEWIKKLAEKYSEVSENQKAAMAKKLAKASASSEKGKAAVTLPKAPFEIPEDIPANERTAFHGAAAGAHKAGKTHFTFQGKKYPVTMKKDTATAIADDVKEAKADDATVRMMKDNPDMRDQQGPGGMKSLDRKAHSAVKKALQKKENDEVVMNPKKEKKEKSTETDNMAQESTLPPVYARIVEARGTADKDGKHYKKAADQEDWNEKEKNNKGAMDMKADMKANNPDVVDNPEAGDQMTKAANAAPKAPARKGDNAAGDKKIIPSATPTKGM